MTVTDNTDQLLTHCPVCGSGSFTQYAVIWDDLAEAWELTDYQRAYIDDQQGLCCDRCMCNLRSMTLASAILHILDSNDTFIDCCMRNPAFRSSCLLEINEAGTLSRFLKQLPGYFFAPYPEYDMQALELDDESFDFILHSDTLEHVPNSTCALRECYRVLRNGGHMVYTIPITPERITRSRVGLPPSYHGKEVENLQDYLVHREYGSDFWCEIFESGFRHVCLHSIMYPASISIIARR